MNMLNLDVLIVRQCAGCKRYKPVEEFQHGRSRHGKDFWQKSCMECVGRTRASNGTSHQWWPAKKRKRKAA